MDTEINSNKMTKPVRVKVENEEPLHHKKLEENMRRLERDAIPLIYFFNNLSALSNWTSLYMSGFWFITYMYTAWHGWTIPMLLLLTIVRLSINYLISKGWDIKWSIVPEQTEALEPQKEDPTVREKIHQVLDVAQQAQNLFGLMADNLEKGKNLFMWVQPDSTIKFYVFLWVSFISTCFLPYQMLGSVIVLSAGFKFFLVDLIFNNYPTLKQQYDSFLNIWKSLPTDLQLKKDHSDKMHHTLSSRFAAIRARLSSFTGLHFRNGGSPFPFRKKKRAFHEIFSIPESEQPLPEYKTGWRCCMINRNRKKEFFGYGVLYVTENYLCFRNSMNKFNKAIKITDIKRYQRFKFLSALPGPGSGMSIQTPTTKKPLLFMPVIHKERVYQAISSQMRKVFEQAALHSARVE